MGLSNYKIRRIFWVGFISSLLFFGMMGFFISSMDDDNFARLVQLFSSNLKYHTEIPILVEDFGNFEPEYNEIYSGPGENGKPYILPPEKNHESIISTENYGMNIVCSDEISLDRTIKDTRLEECKHWDYPLNLPKASVIIVFYNEGLSVVLRTVHSVLNRSPENLLHEIILIDDFSDKEDLQEDLYDYIQRLNGKVKLLRNSKREGLIATKSRGAKEATGEIIIYLDAYCEVNINWLPPLLAPIFRDPKTMTVPIVDRIDSQTFEYLPIYGDEHIRGIFEWGMLYKEKKLPEAEEKKRLYNSEPYKSPTHAGGLFAINREYFLQLGTYDPGLLIWGGANFEFSFKIWQCGGSIEWVPCSRVGHVYRDFIPDSFGDTSENYPSFTIKSNYKRVVETWFDDKFKEYFYAREPALRDLDMGDISDQLKLKKYLKCKSFQWYIDNVAYDIYEDFPALPVNTNWGELKLETTNKCLQAPGDNIGSPMLFKECKDHYFSSQIIRLNTAGQLGVGDRCIDIISGFKVSEINKTVLLNECPLGQMYGTWIYNSVNHHLIHGGVGDCLTFDVKSENILLKTCSPTWNNSKYQQWIFNNFQ